ncbi:MAG: radical SAM protein [Spirochaetaceae bacterium]|jgi:nitrogen fixation protein NifB|nr:radical SAM protein [Spirochaetaceae bacterium]
MNKQLTHIANQHPCFSAAASGKALMTHGRIHLPVSPVCNIRCRFCERSFNKTENRPGVTAGILKPEAAVSLVRGALKLCPEISVAGIAGPGDTLASPHALETFRRIHREFPRLIKCLSTNGLLLEKYAEDLFRAGVKTITVTVNAVDPVILDRICSRVILDGKVYEGTEGAAILIEAQERGIRKAAETGMLIKINIVLIPPINGGHIAEIAGRVKERGVALINIIPLIPQYEFAGFDAPDCIELSLARKDAEAFLPVFRHCRHCRADACGLLGKENLTSRLSGLLPEELRNGAYQEAEQTFSHG